MILDSFHQTFLGKLLFFIVLCQFGYLYLFHVLYYFVPQIYAWGWIILHCVIKCIWLECILLDIVLESHILQRTDLRTWLLFWNPAYVSDLTVGEFDFSHKPAAPDGLLHWTVWKGAAWNAWQVFVINSFNQSDQQSESSSTSGASR